MQNKWWGAQLIVGPCFMCFRAGSYWTDGTKRKWGKNEWSLCSCIKNARVWPFTLAVILCDQGDPGAVGDIGVKGDQVRGAAAHFHCHCTSRLSVWGVETNFFQFVFQGPPGVTGNKGEVWRNCAQCFPPSICLCWCLLNVCYNI